MGIPCSADQGLSDTYLLVSNRQVVSELIKSKGRHMQAHAVVAIQSLDGDGRSIAQYVTTIHT